jgi:Holliday junction resolvasome RuvABC endonuclease subunit
MPPIKTWPAAKKILVIDPSASHLAYCIIEFNGGLATVRSANIIWTKDSWSRGKKFTFMQNCISSIIQIEAPDFVYSEAFFTNPKMKMGSLVIPVINGLIEMICHQHTLPEPEFISPTVWRKVLDIKADKSSGSRDYKGPTKQAVEKFLNMSFPATVISNMTGNSRAFPNDISDVVAIGLAISLESGYKHIDYSKDFLYNSNYGNLE